MRRELFTLISIAIGVSLIVIVVLVKYWDTIGVNVISDFITFGILFIVTYLFIYWVQRHGAEKVAFFGIGKSSVTIFLGQNLKDKESGPQINLHTHNASRALEKMLRQTEDEPRYKIVNVLLGLIGQESYFRLTLDIFVAPKNASRLNQLPYGAIIIIDGPEANSITHLLQEKGELTYIFSKTLDCYQDTREKDKIIGKRCAFIEKIVLSNSNLIRTIFVIHGHRAEDTEAAAKYLRDHWNELHQVYGLQAFAFEVPEHFLP